MSINFVKLFCIKTWRCGLGQQESLSVPLRYANMYLFLCFPPFSVWLVPSSIRSFHIFLFSEFFLFKIKNTS